MNLSHCLRKDTINSKVPIWLEITSILCHIFKFGVTGSIPERRHELENVQQISK